MYDTADKHGSSKGNKLGDKRFTAVDPVKGDVRSIMGDIAPLIIAGPAGHSLGHITGQELTAPHMVHMIIQRYFSCIGGHTG